MSFVERTCTRGHDYAYPGDSGFGDPGCFTCEEAESVLIDDLLVAAHNACQVQQQPTLEAAVAALRAWYDE